jgi:hypothetical protein
MLSLRIEGAEPRRVRIEVLRMRSHKHRPQVRCESVGGGEVGGGSDVADESINANEPAVGASWTRTSADGS